MHVTFVSQCEGRAIKKTRAVLDSYANRIGNFAWNTPITTEALAEVRTALKRKATRQMAVACYRNDGIRRMRLLWVVGSAKQFGRNGEIAIATRKHKSTLLIPAWMNDVIAVASLSGLSHDFGKASKEFAEKITPANAGTPTADPIRHDLVSAVILKKMLAGLSWNDAWDSAGYISKSIGIVAKHKNEGLVLDAVINTVSDSILFCIATHHRLFEKGTAGNHVRDKSQYEIVKAAVRDDSDIAKLAHKVVVRINNLSSKPSTAPDMYWIGVTLLARAALILADHKVSADKSHPYVGKEADTVLFANTTKTDQGKMIYNQTLVNHLSSVGNEAARMVKNMAALDAPSLQPESIERLTAHAIDRRYEWQNIAANHLTPGMPTLVLNIAATGAGKTRMNARAAAVLAGDKPLRLTTVLNLRTLTLQTGDSYKKDLGIADDELSVVIGSATTVKLHEYESCDITQGDLDASEEIDGDVVFDGSQSLALPEWLRPIAEKKKSAAAVLMSPVLVSTIDYVISAGDPRKQATHAIALLRLMHSDLIIDEIDGYEPKALSAVLRLIRLSAMFGRNVIVSSGTLPDIIAQYVWDSYHSGRKIYNAMNGASEPFECVIFDDSVTPSTAGVEQFNETYKKHIAAMMEAVTHKPISKKAEIIKFNKSLDGINGAIKSAVNVMHDRHAWGDDNGKVSIGLVRVANIHCAIPVAKMLAAEPDTFVCCYHARHFTIQRYQIEKRLDELLNRKKGNQLILNDVEIKSCIEKSIGHSARIVVVATPVEEVGRDHDFDWAIIEPSSTQSIVQTAGRINRHRQVGVSEPNIEILQFNFKEVERYKAVFTRPGYEYLGIDSSTHPSHDLCLLIDEPKINMRLDSSLRFDTISHKFSEYDTKSIKASLEEFFGPIIKNESKWMDSDFYEKASLRDKDKTDSWYLDEDGNWYKKDFVFQKGYRIYQPQEGNLRWEFHDKSNELFALSLIEMKQLAEDVGITHEEAFSVQVYPDYQDDNVIQARKYIMTPFGCETT